MFDPIYEEVTAGLYDLVEKHMSKDDPMYRFFDWLPEDVRPPPGGMETLESLGNLPYQSKSLASLGPEFVYRLLHGTPLIRRDMVKLNTEEDILNSFPPSWMWEEDKRVSAHLFPFTATRPFKLFKIHKISTPLTIIVYYTVNVFTKSCQVVCMFASGDPDALRCWGALLGCACSIRGECPNPFAPSVELE